MSAKSTNRLPVRGWRFGVWGTLLAGGILIDEQITAAPTVIVNPVPVQPLMTEDQQDQPNEMEVFQPAGQAAQNTLPEIFTYGPVKLRPHLDYILMYGTGIQNAPGDQQDTVIQELSPGILVNLGPHWTIDYTPTFNFYSSDKLQDSVNQSVALTGGVRYEDWQFGLTHSSQFTTQPMVETGGETEQSTHATAFSASHPLNSQMSFDLGLSQVITLVSGFQDSYDWSTTDWLNYKFWPRLNAGLGVGAGYVLVEGDGQAGGGNNLDQTYELLSARVNWRATDKISFQVNGGLEDRQFQTAGAGNSLNPIFGAAIQYQPFAATQISLSGSRTVSSSDYYLAAQQTESTILGVNLDQRLFGNFHLGAGVNYTIIDYNTASGAGPASAVNRSDDVISYNIRLSHPFLKRGTWSLFYTYSDDQSSQVGYGFQSNQTGFEISYSY